MRKPQALVLVLAIFLAFAARLFGTAQAPDELRIDDKTYYIDTNPLAEYLHLHPGALPRSEVISTANWRGYVATWRLADGKLQLEDVRIATRRAMDPDAPEEEKSRSVLTSLFPSGGPQDATWFSGYLIVPTGELVKYVHMGYASTFSSNLIVKVEEGSVTAQRAMDQKAFESFRRDQFERFKRTPGYSEEIKRLREKNDPMTEKEVEEFLFEAATEEYMSRIFDGPSEDGQK